VLDPVQRAAECRLERDIGAERRIREQLDGSALGHHRAIGGDRLAELLCGRAAPLRGCAGIFDQRLVQADVLGASDAEQAEIGDLMHVGVVMRA